MLTARSERARHQVLGSQQKRECSAPAFTARAVFVALHKAPFARTHFPVHTAAQPQACSPQVPAHRRPRPIPHAAMCSRAKRVSRHPGGSLGFVASVVLTSAFGSNLSCGLEDSGHNRAESR